MKIKILDCLKKMEIFYKNKKISFNSIDSIIINLINDVFGNINNKNNLIITLEEEITIVYMFLVVGISSYYKNMNSSKSNILDILQEGDKVCYKRVIYRYSGFNIINNKKYIKLLGSGRVITYIPVKNAYELTLYNGESTRINKSKTLPDENLTNLTKQLIAEIMNEDICNLNGIIEESNLIVIRGKEMILDIIQHIEIVVNSNRVPFTELFCSAYWSSGDGEANIIKNTIKEDIIFNITTSTSTALDIIMSNNKIKNVIVIGERTYKDYLDTDLRRISFNSDIKKILLFDTWQSNDTYDYFMNEDNNYEVRAINKDIILDNVNLYDDKGFGSDSKLQVLQYNMARKLVNKNINIKYVDDSNEFNKDMNQLIGLLRQLCAYVENSDHVLTFVKVAYSLCNRIERTIIPLRYCKENDESIKLKINGLEKIKKNFHETRREYDIMSQIIDLFKNISSGLNYKNEKFISIKEIGKNKERILLVLKNKDELESINWYLSINRLNNIKALLFSNNINYCDYDVVIVSFYSENISLIKSNNISKLQIIGYNREFNRYRRLINNNTNMMKLMSISNEIDFEYDVEENISFLDNGDKYQEIVETDGIIEDILDKSFIRLITSKEYNSDNMKSNNSKLMAKKLVVFKDGKYTFLSENYICNYLNKSQDDICTKVINEIEIGDKLIFVVNERNGKGDIVKDVIEKLLKYKEFEDLYGEYFRKNKYWKNCLIQYMKKNNLDEKDMANRFRIHGQTITALAISSWLNGNIIGPQSPNNIKLIAEIIGDNTLKEDIDSIITSCKQVRSIQIKIRKSIARMIIDSVISNETNDSDIYKLVKKVIGDYKNYAYVGEVEYVKDIEKEIGTQYINKVNKGVGV